MTMRRFVNRQGWERWINVEGLPDRYRVVESPDLTQGLMLGANVIERAPRLLERIFHLTEWRNVYGAREVIVYVEDHDTGLLDANRFGAEWPSLDREREMARVLSKIAECADLRANGPMGYTFGAGPRLDDINTFLSHLPPETLGRDPRRCYQHPECRESAALGHACRRSSPKESPHRD